MQISVGSVSKLSKFCTIQVYKIVLIMIMSRVNWYKKNYGRTRIVGKVVCHLSISTEHRVVSSGGKWWMSCTYK